MRLARIAALIHKDLLLDARRLSEAGSMLVFVAAASVLASYAVRGSVSPRAGVEGLLIVMVFLAVYTALSSFIREAERGTLDALRVSPATPEEVFTAKLVYSLILLYGSSLAYSLLYAFFSGDASLLAPPALLVTLLVALYMAAASSLSSAILVYSEARSFLLPVTITVLILPYLQAAAPALNDAVLGAGVAEGGFAMLSIAAAGFAALTVWLSRYALEAL